MYLKRIEIYGFKSFGRKADLEFTQPISSIVGPNGSGKSNVAEAFRFVLGEQSIKSLRGKRAEDLIFNGGKEAPRANRAAVKVIFDNSKRLLKIDFDEVSLERVVHRDSSSEYFINGSLVRLKDIIELLASAHIGASGHHIISQGEGDRILNANPRDRREMIEDALGLKIYQYKKNESEKKLEKTLENIGSVESLRREIAPHIRFLKKQVEKIEKTIEMRNELTKLYLEYFRREDIYLLITKDLLTKEKAEPINKMLALEQEMHQAKRVLESSQTKDARSDEIIQIENELKQSRSQKDSAMHDLGRLDGEIASMERLLQKQRDLASRVIDQKVSLSEVEGLTREAVSIIDEAISNENVAELRLALEKIKQNFVSYLTAKKGENPTQDFSETEGEIEKLKSKKVILLETIESLRQNEKSWQERYETVRLSIEREKDSNRDAEKAVFRIVAEQNELRGQLAMIKNREDKLVSDEASFQNELKEASVLAGVAALHFKTHSLVPESGLALTDDDIYAEPRHMQEERRRTLERIKIRLEDSGIGGSADEVMKEYKETTERDDFLGRELEDLSKTMISLKQLILELNSKIDEEFRNGVTKINNQFQNFFALMFGGGTAMLSLVREVKRKKKDTDLPGEEGLENESDEGTQEEREGLDIEVNLPRKKIKGLMMLSGGERALTSIALLFAMSQVNPPPFIILDETDAPLDEANSRRYGDMIENLSKFSQLILITHNRETMSRAGIIYGVTMGADGVSKVLSIEFGEAIAVAK